jgi:hypothetical protein
MKYQGSCHCGRIAFEVEGDIGEVYDCNCSMCRRRGGLLWFGPRDAFTLKTPESDVATYTFNKHVIQHHFCTNCGISPYGEGEKPNAGPMIAVNVRCLPELELSALKVTAVDGASF